jgi:thiamine biosynthesis lipoprotein
MSTISTMALVPQLPGMALTTRTEVLMDTFVTIGVVREGGADNTAIARAFDWFRRVEAACSRFDRDSEVLRLLDRVGEPTPVSAILYQAVAFAIAVARASGGAFDPTIGHLLAERGFARNYRTGETIIMPLIPLAAGGCPTFRDVRLDPHHRTIALRRPLILDLGAVAKGLAIDLAGQELAPTGRYLIDAGGDLAVRGQNPAGAPWQIGIRHPRQDAALLATLRLTDAAVCTSGDYERPAAAPAAGHHLFDPRAGRSPAAVASVTVIAPTALAADALGTAAFILGPRRGVRFLARQGVAGMLVTPDLTLHSTPDFGRYTA